MKVNIIKEKYNEFLKRKEMDVLITHENSSTPRKSELQHFIAKMLNIDVRHVDIRNIFSLEGMAKSRSKIFIWDEKKVENLAKKVKERKSEITKEKKDEEKKN